VRQVHVGYALQSMRRWLAPQLATRLRQMRGVARGTLSEFVRLRRRIGVLGFAADAVAWVTSGGTTLFDSSFYLERNPDVAAKGRNPLLHYLTHGAREGRDPHALFDASFYVERYPDVATKGRSPLLHYLRHGAREGRDPHPFFDTAFYLDRNPDVAATGVNPLVHYVRHGAREGRNPHPSFNTSFYLRRYPDVAASGLNPLVHFVLHGAREGRLGCPPREVQDYLPVASPPRSAWPEGLEVDVVIPVYLGLPQTRRSVDSVRRTYNRVPSRLVIVNDASPDPEIHRYLRALPQSAALVVVENTENLGFVRSVNRGMRLSEAADVVLLNSDTEVADGWLDRLAAAAHAQPNTATVTPFSNNATICSYPRIGRSGRLPEGESTESLDAIFAAVNRGRAIEVPTAIGFCMYIRRDCLSQIGLFDETAFGKGYGEENDFCLRATAAGWRHLLALDTFVFHEGEASFSDRATAARARAEGVIRTRFPDYEPAVASWISLDPAAPFRCAVTAARYRRDARPVILLVTHSLGGGTEKHVASLVSGLERKARFLTLRPAFGGRSLLETSDPADGVKLEVDLDRDVEFLVALLRSFGTSRVHIHHTFGFSSGLRRAVLSLGVPFDFTVHDYLTVCPQTNLVDEEGRYCGEPRPESCNRCVARRPSHGSSEIRWWRLQMGWVIREADRVFCPSEDVARRIRRYHPSASTVIVPHEAVVAVPQPSPRRAVPPEGVLRVAVLGVLARHKGAELVGQVARAAAARGLPLEFRLVGSWHADVTGRDAVSATGPYDDTELPHLLERAAPDVVWFPATVPETYGYTLSAALEAGLPVIASDLGALPERLHERPWSWLVPWDSSADEMLDFLCRIRREHFVMGTGPQPPSVLGEAAASRAEGTATFYRDLYLVAPHSTVPPVDLRERNRLSVLLLPEIDRGPSPCSYIRLLLPLLHPSVSERVAVTVVRASEVHCYRADALILNRTAVTRCDEVDRIVDHCRAVGIPIVYDLDDDLLSIGEGHPEFAAYRRQRGIIVRWLREADQVWVSTPALRDRVTTWASSAEVIPNALFEELWFQPREEGTADGGSVGVLYMGTQTHDRDLALLSPVVRGLKAEFGPKVRFELIGGTLDKELARDWERLVPPRGTSSYPPFVGWLMSQAERWQIGLAPLADGPFNAAKSGVKYLDYGAMGLAPVCSDVPAYRQILRHGITGRLVPNDPERWYKELRNLVTDAERRQQLAANAKDEVRKTGLLEPQARRRVRLLEALKAAPPARSPVSGGSNPKDDLAGLGREDVAAMYLHGDGIEIGALQNPLKVADTARVRYVDRMSKGELRAHYPELADQPLVDVDLIDDGEHLATFPDRSVDFVIANHFLEHAEDPIATLGTLLRVVRPGGRVFLAVPDKRASFDRRRTVTPLEHLVADHEEGPTRSRRQHYEDWVRLVEPEFGRNWSNEEAARRADELQRQNYSIHFHAWDPAALRELLHHCAKSLSLSFEVEFFGEYPSEMVTVLRRAVSS
jgi:GT2 family glycosyltransferase/glycosyltransferase involved in cell wall biosynthesis/SAM-dependent methyltransferase